LRRKDPPADALPTFVYIVHPCYLLSINSTVNQSSL
jgi:hypothetical protein